jgi:hypothetical protein
MLRHYTVMKRRVRGLLALLVGAAMPVIMSVAMPAIASADTAGQIDCVIVKGASDSTRCALRPTLSLEPISTTPPPSRTITIEVAAHSHSDAPHPNNAFASLLRLRARSADRDAPEEGVRIRAILKSKDQQSLAESDAPAGAVQFLLAAGPGEERGLSRVVDVSREDFGKKAIDLEISVEHVALDDSTAAESDEPEAPGWYVGQLAQGQMQRTWIEQTTYRRLRELGVCSGARERPCTVDADIYQAVSRMLGRVPELEFSRNKKENRSEPIVLFVGLSGVTGIALLECKARLSSIWSGSKVDKPCEAKAEPWSISLQRAPYFWAAYIEDIDTPYRTTIDVEFRRRAEPVDYEEFDPATLAGRLVGLPSTAAGRAPAVREANPSTTPATTKEAAKELGPVPIRVGFKRFHMREAPANAQVGFSREGQGYGLRQWVRMYQQYSRRRWGLGAGMLVSAIPATTHDVTTRDLFRDGATQPFAHELVEEQRDRVLFAFVAARWYQWRERSRDKAAPLRFLENALVPDLALGVGVPSSPGPILVGLLSWPLPLVRDRITFMLGGRWVHDDIFREGFVRGGRVPLTVNAEDVSRKRWSAGVLLGIAVDVAQWR